MTNSHHQEIVHLSTSIALMRSLNNHLLQTRDFTYGETAEGTIDDTLFKLDLVISELDQIRDGYAREINEAMKEQGGAEKSETEPTEHQIIDKKTRPYTAHMDPMSVMICRDVPAMVKRHLAQHNNS